MAPITTLIPHGVPCKTIMITKSVGGVDNVVTGTGSLVVSPADFFHFFTSDVRHEEIFSDAVVPIPDISSFTKWHAHNHQCDPWDFLPRVNNFR